MRARNMMLLAFVAVFSAAAHGTEPEAWWDICDGCTSDSDFSSRALQIPAPYERVYISNTLTNETRRFQRTIIMDDLWAIQVRRFSRTNSRWTHTRRRLSTKS